MGTEEHSKGIERQISLFSKNILKWWKTNNRNYLFWRKTRDPYCILMAEIMLQKTTAKQVSSVIQQFVERFPSPQALAMGPITEIEKLITPLGLEHKRSAICQKLAQTIVEKHHSNVPETEEELISLPGVGKYIANGVLCFAFGKEVPIVDTNVRRVLGRVFGVKTSNKKAQHDKMVWNLALRIVAASNGESKNLNFALLDFAALACTLNKPKCNGCFAGHFCRARR